MLRFANKFAGLYGLLLFVVFISSTVSRPSGSRRSPSFDDAAGAKMFMNKRGEISGDELYNKRGELASNPRIYLQGEKRQSSNFNYGSTKVRGVNIGGWLVAEPWITPSLFDDTGDSRVIDEWTFGKYVSNAGSRLESHWSSFITQDDFDQIAAAGLNHVRIPIGYWALDKGSSPYYKGSQYSHLKKAVKWARSAGLKVIVDLHGAPGSQNGFDNSGRKGPLNWFTKESYKSRAKAVIQKFAQDFMNDADTVTAIELLNEPATTSGPSNALSFYEDYYNNAYYAVRYPSGSQQNTNVDVMVHDGFQDLSYWHDKLQPPTFQGVLLDTHQYSVFSPEQVALSNTDRLNYFCSLRSTIGGVNPHLYTIVGEWTNAPTDCAKYLNGRGVGARYDGTYPGTSKVGSCSKKTGTGKNFSSSYKSFLGRMFATQRSVYESSGSGWVFWTWKTEQAADWDYQRGLKGNWIPSNLNNFSGAQC